MKSVFLLIYVSEIVQIRKQVFPISQKKKPNNQVTTPAIANPELQTLAISKNKVVEFCLFFC